MKLLLIITALSCLSGTEFRQEEEPSTFNTYCNARFRYCIDYPVFLKAQPESENGDGRIFTGKAGEKVLTVFGRLNQDSDGNPISLQNQYEKDRRDLHSSGINISYKKLGKNFYVLSGQKANTVVYRKTIIKDEAFCFAYLEYDIAQNTLFDSILPRISQSFK